MLTTNEERGIVKGKRNALLRLLRVRFGSLPIPIESAIADIELEDELDNLFDRVITAKSLDEMGLTVR